MADTKISLFNMGYPLSGNEMIPMSQTDTSNADVLTTFITSPSALAYYIKNVFRLVPAGAVIPTAGNSITPPDGWLYCNGAEVNIVSYSDLFRSIGTTYGTPSNASVFKLPDLRGKAIFGNGFSTTPRDANGNSASANSTFVLGISGGEYVHTLSANELPRHRHDYTLLQAPSVKKNTNDVANPTYANNATGLPGQTRSTTYIGSDDPHNNMPPFLVLNYLIKT